MTMGMGSWARPFRYISWEDADNCDTTFPLKMYRFIPSEIKRVDSAVLQFNADLVNPLFLPEAPIIGSIFAWAKNLSGAPALPDNFVECNGQVLNDDESLLNGVTIPNLNGNNYFLKGNSTSGGTGGVNNPILKLGAVEGAGTGAPYMIDANPNPPWSIDPTAYELTFPLPAHYNVVWVMKTKAAVTPLIPLNADFCLHLNGNPNDVTGDYDFTNGTATNYTADLSGKFGTNCWLGTGASNEPIYRTVNAAWSHINACLEFWVKPTNTINAGSGVQRPFYFFDAPYLPVNNDNLRCGFDEVGDGKLYVYLGAPGFDVWLVSTTNSWTAGTWYHIAIAMDGTNAKLYVNGTQEDSINFTAAIPWDNGTVFVGGQTSTAQVFKGRVEEVIWWKETHYFTNFTPPLGEAIGISVTIRINGVDRTVALGGPWMGQAVVDIVQYLNVGEWNTIELIPTELARIKSNVLVTVTV